MATVPPYKAEYAKSGRASCKLCKSKIDKNALRLAVMVQFRFAPFIEYKAGHWFHSLCFFQEKRPDTVGDIEDFDSLRYEDQEMIKKMMIAAGGSGAGASASGAGKGKGKKGAGGASDFN